MSTIEANVEALSDVAAACPRPSLGAAADAIGHCVLVFAFLPTLTAVPAWLRFEVTSAVNLEDGVVLSFLPVRAAILLLHAFRAGMVTSVVAGLAAGVLFSVWVRSRGPIRSRGGRLGLGALIGIAAAAAGLGVGLAIVSSSSGTVPEVPLRVLGFELVTATVCGMVAAPRALRLLEGR